MTGDDVDGETRHSQIANSTDKLQNYTKVALQRILVLFPTLKEVREQTKKVLRCIEPYSQEKQSRANYLAQQDSTLYFIQHYVVKYLIAAWNELDMEKGNPQIRGELHQLWNILSSAQQNLLQAQSQKRPTTIISIVKRIDPKQLKGAASQRIQESPFTNSLTSEYQDLIQWKRKDRLKWPQVLEKYNVKYKASISQRKASKLYKAAQEAEEALDHSQKEHTERLSEDSTSPRSKDGKPLRSNKGENATKAAAGKLLLATTTPTTTPVQITSAPSQRAEPVKAAVEKSPRIHKKLALDAAVLAEPASMINKEANITKSTTRRTLQNLREKERLFEAEVLNHNSNASLMTNWLDPTKRQASEDLSPSLVKRVRLGIQTTTLVVQMTVQKTTNAEDAVADDEAQAGENMEMDEATKMDKDTEIDEDMDDQDTKGL